MANKSFTELSERPERALNKVVCIMPAYNAESTLEKTYNSIPKGIVHDFILTDDCSSDNTAEVAERLGMTVIRHEKNMGYGANQKTCYDAALDRGADVVVMIHPDYQYDGRITPAVLKLLATGTVDVILGSRIRSRKEALEGGMPVYKYLSNRFLTIFENFMLGQNAGDMHSGYRAYSADVLKAINYKQNSDDFVFDTQFLAQVVRLGFRIGDVPIPTRYFDEASSINFQRSLKYGLQTVGVMFKFALDNLGLAKLEMFKPMADCPLTAQTT